MTHFSHVDGFENSRFWHSSLDSQLRSSIKFLWYIFAVRSIRETFLTVDGYNMNKNQVSLAVTLWLSGVVVDRAFTSGGVDVRAEAYLSNIAA